MAEKPVQTLPDGTANSQTKVMAIQGDDSLELIDFIEDAATTADVAVAQAAADAAQVDADAAQAAADAAQATADGAVARSGDVMTGALTLSGDPTFDLQAATKRYVDDNIGGGGGGGATYGATYDVRAYGAVLDGVTDDTAAFQSAITAAAAAGGGQIFVPEGQTVITDRLDFTARGMSIVGAGTIATDIRLQDASAGLDFGEFGGWSGNFRIHAESIATSPLKMQAGANRQFGSIIVESSAGVGWYLTGIQNCLFEQIQVYRSANENVVIDGDVAGNLFLKCEFSDIASNSHFQVRYCNDIAGLEPFNNTFTSTIIERADTGFNPLGQLSMTAGYLTLDESLLVPSTSTVAQDIVSMSGTAKGLYLSNTEIQGFSGVAHDGIVATAGTVTMTGRNGFTTLNRAILIQSPVIVYVNGRLTYSGVTTEYEDLAVSGRLREVAIRTLSSETLYRTARATTAIVETTTVSGESAARFERLGTGALQWGSGSGAADTALFRNGAAILKTTGRINTDTVEIVGTGTNNGYMHLAALVASNPFPAAGFKMWSADDGGTTVVRGRFNTGSVFEIYREGVGNVETVSVESGQSAVTIWRGTQAAYDALTPDADTLYFING